MPRVWGRQRAGRPGSALQTPLPPLTHCYVCTSLGTEPRSPLECGSEMQLEVREPPPGHPRDSTMKCRQLGAGGLPGRPSLGMLGPSPPAR